MKSEINEKLVSIQEYYEKDENGIVWWYYRVNGFDWVKQKTPYTDIPFNLSTLISPTGGMQ